MNSLEKRYSDHHRQGHRLGFTFGGGVRIRQIHQWVGQGRRILDLGCRDGTLTATFGEGNYLVGADIDSGSLSLGLKSGRLQKAVQLNAGSGLPFESEAFDTMVCGEVLEHLPFPDTRLEEAGRILPPGGLFVGSVPNAYRLKNRLNFLMGRPFDKDPTHLRYFSICSLRYLLSPWFENIEIRPIIGRFVWLHPALFANSLIWRCTRRVKRESTKS
jgi:SAM-dependent methyltransferase